MNDHTTDDERVIAETWKRTADRWDPETLTLRPAPITPSPAEETR